MLEKNQTKTFITKSVELTISPRSSGEVRTLTGKEWNNDTWNGDIWLHAAETDNPETPWCLRILAILTENLEENVTWADPLKAHAHFLTASPNHSLLPPDPQLGSNPSTL